MPFMTWDLWLARALGIDKPLPWQIAQIEWFKQPHLITSWGRPVPHKSDNLVGR